MRIRLNRASCIRRTFSYSISGTTLHAVADEPVCLDTEDAGSDIEEGGLLTDILLILNPRDHDADRGNGPLRVVAVNDFGQVGLR